MKKWKIFVTFFRKIYDDHYTVDSSLNLENFTFIKVNEEYEPELDNKLNYDIFFERDFSIYSPSWQRKGYHENSVFYHIYKNGYCKGYDYIGFIEYDHVLKENFTRTIQTILDQSSGDLIFAFNKFSFEQLWNQGVIMDPRRLDKETGDPESEWNCIRVILNDYNDFFGTKFTVEDLIRKNCFPICHCFLVPTQMFHKLMKFHTYIMESGKVENYHRHNWRAKAGLMERYLAVELALEETGTIDSIQLEHRAYPIKVLKPDWYRPSLLKRLKCLLKRT